ncbi:hypothetical protein DWW95_03115 [Ruminococcus sp. AF17-6LB]|uniref:hypothetical protein n=1 Tax=unclassified Ruminococcus TaxID=2608920 RepID=UPI000E52A7B8|nr:MULTISPECIES: hypothetical protein [unclassified Ruminococcus]RGG73112.1 hypothetical protein DWW95_03115 [Ruminococcus sp. AF17-6LB]RGG74759.1 hypothetical protein DWW94_03110 [Ruminococcus sp. AF17-6]RGG75149.1 hypothetical protein DWW87_03035 [Ruminococcus sp. AF17-24]RGG81523.1 hypothetical protein DWW81_03030 [Ruminococcus sp. AF17-1AC]
MSSVFKDMDQDDRLDTLEKKVKKLERNANGGNKMSGIIKELIGRECTIDGDGYYNTRCTVLDADDEWVKLIIHEKKSDSTMIVRLDNIDSITLD